MLYYVCIARVLGYFFVVVSWRVACGGIKMKSDLYSLVGGAVLYASLASGCATSPSTVVRNHGPIHEVTRGDIRAFPREMSDTVRSLIETGLASRATSPESIFYQSLTGEQREGLAIDYLRNLSADDRVGIIARANTGDESALEEQRKALRFVQSAVENYSTKSTGVPRSTVNKMGAVEGFASQ